MKNAVPAQVSPSFFSRAALERTIGMDDNDYVPIHCPCRNAKKMCSRCIAELDSKLQGREVSKTELEAA